MSDVTFPTYGSVGTQLPGVSVRRPVPIFETGIGAAKTGPEYRVSEGPVRYRYTIDVALREWLGEDATFVGFFEARGGRLDSFLITGPDDVQRRVRFDADDLSECLEWDKAVLRGSIDAVSVITPGSAMPLSKAQQFTTATLPTASASWMGTIVYVTDTDQFMGCAHNSDGSYGWVVISMSSF